MIIQHLAELTDHGTGPQVLYTRVNNLLPKEFHILILENNRMKGNWNIISILLRLLTLHTAELNWGKNDKGMIVKIAILNLYFMFIGSYIPKLNEMSGDWVEIVVLIRRSCSLFKISTLNPQTLFHQEKNNNKQFSQSHMSITFLHSLPQ